MTGYIVAWQEEIRSRRLLLESGPSRTRLLGRKAATSNEEMFLWLAPEDFGAKTAEEGPNSDWPISFELSLKTSHFLLVSNFWSHSFMLLSRYGSENTGSRPASNKRVRPVPRYLPLVHR